MYIKDEFMISVDGDTPVTLGHFVYVNTDGLFESNISKDDIYKVCCLPVNGMCLIGGGANGDTEIKRVQ
jgi:hypothetical protein